ncbi:MAG TPA: threonine synthase [Caulobacteraceae bacterium]|jgi:threonine synthase|nr:threonine synthase [Caulobacteraceae bacterium]
MRYISTRGDAPPVGFFDAVLAGLAPDGGLYVPETWPQLSAEEIAAFAGKPYAEVAADILGRFAGDAMRHEDLLEIASEAYAGFAHPAVVPLSQMDAGLWRLELFHGPTLAFKDVAMQMLARLYERALAANKRNLTVVCATSGDTGGAAVEALAGRGRVKLVVLFPDGRISEVQRRFMTTSAQANVRCLAVKGTFDDCQAIVKALFGAQGFREAVDLTGVNSINWARIVSQAVYYFTAAVALGAPRRPVSFCVPTGNFGDAFAGFVASRMGLPIERIVTATNSNDIVARMIEEGRYARGPVRQTQSPAMDIQVASNFERLYFEGVERNGLETARAMQAFASAGAIDIPPRARALIDSLFTGVGIGEDETSRTILSTLNQTGALIDPHTAVGVAAAHRVRAKGSATPMVVLSTAHPAKFPEAVKAAAGVAPDMPNAARGLGAKPERIDRLPADIQAVQAYIRDFAQG